MTDLSRGSVRSLLGAVSLVFIMSFDVRKGVIFFLAHTGNFSGLQIGLATGDNKKVNSVSDLGLR